MDKKEIKELSKEIKEKESESVEVKELEERPKPTMEEKETRDLLLKKAQTSEKPNPAVQTPEELTNEKEIKKIARDLREEATHND